MSHAQLLERINSKGLEIATILAQLLAGKDVTLEELSELRAQGPRETPEERARRFLAQVNRARTRLHSGDYGSCLECGQAFDQATLQEIPWIESCRDCDRDR